MKSIRKVLAALRKADHKFNLISKGDKIMIGISGGKDSLVLLHAMRLYQNFPHTDFEIVPVMLDLGFPLLDTTKIEKYCQSIGLKLIVADATTVYPILKKQQEIHNANKLPCSICSRMKKAAINKVANEMGFNKVAFAHHADDAIETLLMNGIFGGRLATFSPQMYLENAKITFIRPLILAHENDISQTAKELNLPIMKSACPNDKHTMREETKQYLQDIYQKHPYAKDNFLTMLLNKEQLDLWFDKEDMTIEGTDLTIKEVITKDDTMLMNNIRHEVFIKEQNISYQEEFDGSDFDCTHFLLLKNHNVIGTIRFKVNERTITIGRFAIIKEMRNKGYGTLFFKAIEKLIKDKYNPCTIKLNAQKQAKSFYENLGYQAFGSEFLEANIEHISMSKELK